VSRSRVHDDDHEHASDEHDQHHDHDGLFQHDDHDHGRRRDDHVDDPTVLLDGG
jgi:hypothetical protein